MDTAKSVESLKAEIQKLITDSLKSPFIGKQNFTTASLAGVSELYKRQIEHLGCTNVTVTATLASDGGVNIEARFTPPPAPIVISFTIEPTKE
jgi:hypothetical protein